MTDEWDGVEPPPGCPCDWPKFGSAGACQCCHELWPKLQKLASEQDIKAFEEVQNIGRVLAEVMAERDKYIEENECLKEQRDNARAERTRMRNRVKELETEIEILKTANND